MVLISPTWHNIEKSKKITSLYLYNSIDRSLIGPGIGAASTINLGDWKLIYFHLTGEKELYNISIDIGERNNLVEKNMLKKEELKSMLALTPIMDKKI